MNAKDISIEPIETTSRTISHPAGWSGFVMAVSLIAGLYFVALLLLTSRHYAWPDFSQDYVYALSMRRGENPYLKDLTPLATSLHLRIDWKRAGYTPTFILCFEPITLLSPLAGWWIWTAMNVVFLAAVLLLLLRKRFDLTSGLLFASVAIFYTPLASLFHFGQTGIQMLLLITLTMHWLRNGRDAAAGIALAAAVLLRLYPLVLVGYLLVSRRWRALIWMGLALAVGIMITCTFVGVDRSLSFLQVVVPLSQQLRSPVAISVPGIISHAFWFFVNQPSPALDQLRRTTVLAVCGVIVFLTVRVTARYHTNADQDDRLFALWVVAMVLITPTAWPHYMVLFLLPLALLAAAWRQQEGPVRALWLGVAGYVLTELGTLLTDRKLLPEMRFAWIIVTFAALSPILQYLSAYFLVIDSERWLRQTGMNTAVPIRH